MIDISLHFNRVKQINTKVLKKYKAGVLTLYAGCVGGIGTGSELALFFDNPEQIQILVNALADLYLKMSAKAKLEQSDPDSTDGIKPMLIDQGVCDD